MNRFYITPEEFTKDEIAITGDDFKHLSKVLRLLPGDKIEVYNTQNQKATGQILKIDQTTAKVLLSDKQAVDSENCDFHIDLFQGYPKQTKLEMITQKATELGISSLYPFYSVRTVVKPSKNDSKKIKRLRRIAYEAAKQCGRGSIPVINEPVQLNNLIEKLIDYDLILLAYEDEKKQTLKKTLESLDLTQKPIKIALIIGPEGGFDQEEINFLKENLPINIVSLGNRILRTETAGIAAVSQLNFYFEK